MSRLFQYTPRLFVTSAILACAFGWANWHSQRGTVKGDSTAVLFEETTKTFGEVPVGTSERVVFRLANRSERAVRVLGSSQACFAAGCMSAVALPHHVPAKTTCEVTVVVTTHALGAFRGAISVFTDYPGSEKLPLTVEGVITRPIN